jgi:hypothetical protein
MDEKEIVEEVYDPNSVAHLPNVVFYATISYVLNPLSACKVHNSKQGAIHIF